MVGQKRIQEEVTLTNPQVIDREELMNRLDGDMELLEELFELFVEDYPQFLADIETAILHRDGQKLKQAAHTLKGAVGNFAAKKAFDLAFRLEMMGQEGDFQDAEPVFRDLNRAVEEIKEALAAMKREPV